MCRHLVEVKWHEVASMSWAMYSLRLHFSELRTRAFTCASVNAFCSYVSLLCMSGWRAPLFMPFCYLSGGGRSVGRDAGILLRVYCSS